MVLPCLTNNKLGLKQNAWQLVNMCHDQKLDSTIKDKDSMGYEWEHRELTP